jgi:hypothetical protein
LVALNFSSLSPFATTILEALNKNTAFLPTFKLKLASESVVAVVFSDSPPFSLATIREFTAPVFTFGNLDF